MSIRTRVPRGEWPTIQDNVQCNTSDVPARHQSPPSTIVRHVRFRAMLPNSQITLISTLLWSPLSQPHQTLGLRGFRVWCLDSPRARYLVLTRSSIRDVWPALVRQGHRRRHTVLLMHRLLHLCMIVFRLVGGLISKSTASRVSKVVASDERA